MNQKTLLLRLVALVAAMMCAIGASAAEAYACYMSSRKTLTFYYDNLRSSRSGTTYDLNTGGADPGWVTDGTNASVDNVVFDSSFAGARPTSTFSWFYHMEGLLSITGLNYLNTSEVTKMNWMFGYCTSLTSLDLSNFNTSKVTDMGAMFYGSRNLKILDLSGFNTSKVINMGTMFWECAELLTVFVDTNWSTSAVTTSTNMFYNCTSLVGGLGTTFSYSNPRDKTYAHIDGGTNNPGYFTAKGTEAYACYTSSNTTLTFYYDTQRGSRSGRTYVVNKDIDNPGWLSDGTNANVTTVVFDSSFANARPTSTYQWLCSMENLQTIKDISNLNTSQVTTMGYMFGYCTQLRALDLSNFNTDRVKETRFMFEDCSNLRTIYVSQSWSTAAITTSNGMFTGCVNIKGGLGTTYNDNHVDKTYAHIDGGTSNPGYFTDIKDYTTAIFEVDGIYYKVDTYDVLVTHDGTGQYGCYSGTVEIPEQVYNDNDGWWYTVGGIDERAFYRCPYLKHLILPNSIGIIHNEAFMDAFLDASNSTITCMALTPPLISPSAPDPYSAPDMTLYVPYGTRSAYQAINAWNQFGNIVELNYSFKKNNIYYKITGTGKVSVTYKDGNYNTYSGRVSVPASVTYGGVTYTVTAIDNLAFFGCTNLTEVNMPLTVTTIGNRTFKGCTALTSITIPNSVTSMGVNVFENCTSLKNVVIGSGMTSIATSSFHGCTALETGTITCLAQVPPTINSQSAFDTNHYHNSTLYVPKSSYEDYQQAQYWRDFYDMRELWTLDEALNIEGGTLHFESTGDYPWVTVSEPGNAYAMSGNKGVHSSVSTLTTTVTLAEDTPFSFAYKAWGETNSAGNVHYDVCEFAIDGGVVFASGAHKNQEWVTHEHILPAGTHTLTWSYTKDDSVNPEGDYFAIDNVNLGTRAYACYTSSNTTLTFYYDNQRDSRQGVTYDLNTGSDDTGWDTDGINANVTKVVFDPSFADARPTTTCDWFYNMRNLQSITGMSYLNTSEVTDMKYMFLDCEKLTSVDVSHFNTSKVTDMYAMFSGCSALTSLDLSSFNTSMVSEMGFMFKRCTNLRTIYAGNGWNTDAVTQSYYMFNNCLSLVGGQGTTWNSSNPADKTYAHIDGGPSNPGYLTDKNAGQRGDVNGDNSVTISDVTALINYLLTQNATGVNLNAADCNQDHNVTISDVTALIAFLLSGSW